MSLATPGPGCRVGLAKEPMSAPIAKENTGQHYLVIALALNEWRG
jgi:hypothetical protein